MNVALRRPMTMTEFLAWENRQELRYEFDGFQPVAMVGGSVSHSLIQVNLLAALNGRLQGSPCLAHGSHLKVLVAGRVRYPDAFITCTPASPTAQIIDQPVIIFEILSPNTSHSDMIAKNAEYRATPSVQRYVILHQSQPGAVVFSRKGEDWVAETVRSGGTLRLPEVGIELPFDLCYLNVTFPEPDPDEASDIG